MRLMYALQDALPQRWRETPPHRLRDWLDIWRVEILRFVELKGGLEAADFLGVQEERLRTWVAAQKRGGQ
jgi:hypothetical protein